MRFSLLNTLTLGLLVAISLASGGVTLHINRQHALWDGRIGLAQASYAEHLALQANVNALFKQHADALLFGDRDDGALEEALEDAIARNLEVIRDIVAAEIALVGAEEAPELDLLARIEAKVASLTGTLSTLAADGTPLDTETRRNQLVELLDREIDERLASRIAEALAGEQAEVRQAEVAVAAFRQRTVVVVAVLVGASAVLALLAGIAYHRSVVTPARAISDAVARLRHGDFTRPRAIGGASELRAIGAALELTADSLRDRHAGQAELTRTLESAVAMRTAELSRVLAEVERGEAGRRQLMADVSHELRTPLTIIRGEAEVGLRTAGPEAGDLRDALARIRDTARHANAIVDDLLLIARQESGRLRLDMVPLDLVALVGGTLAFAAGPGADAPEITLRLDLPRAPVRADPVRIRQSLLALLQNARRYGGRRIEIAVTRPGDDEAAPFRLSVADDGPGMDDAEKDRAFERFFRGTNATGSGAEGTGLGLPIVRAIARAHGGSAGLGDRAGGGIVAWIDLPADQGRAAGLTVVQGGHPTAGPGRRAGP